MQYIWGAVMRQYPEWNGFNGVHLNGTGGRSHCLCRYSNRFSAAFLMLLLIPVIAFIFYLVDKRRKNLSIQKIRSDWGTEHLCKERDFETLHSSFKAAGSPEGGQTGIDDQPGKI